MSLKSLNHIYVITLDKDKSRTTLEQKNMMLSLFKPYHNHDDDDNMV